MRAELDAYGAADPLKYEKKRQAVEVAKRATARWTGESCPMISKLPIREEPLCTPRVHSPDCSENDCVSSVMRAICPVCISLTSDNVWITFSTLKGLGAEEDNLREMFNLGECLSPFSHLEEEREVSCHISTNLQVLSTLPCSGVGRVSQSPPLVPITDGQPRTGMISRRLESRPPASSAVVPCVISLILCPVDTYSL